jgi:hypothetical protein
LTPEQAQICIHLTTAEGWRHGEIAARIGCDVAVVAATLREYFLRHSEEVPPEREETPTPTRVPRRKRVTDAHTPHILTLLRAGWTCRRIADTLNYSRPDIEKLSKTTEAASLKRGRGRRYTPAQVEQIRAAVLAGKSNKQIEREFSMGCDGAVSMRKRLGMFKDRRVRDISQEQIAAALAARKDGATWQNSAALIGTSAKTLKRRLGA